MTNNGLHALLPIMTGGLCFRSVACHCMKNCEKGLKNASKVASPCLLQACFLFAIDVFLHFDRRSELTPFIIMVSLI